MVIAANKQTKGFHLFIFMFNIAQNKLVLACHCLRYTVADTKCSVLAPVSLTLETPSINKPFTVFNSIFWTPHRCGISTNYVWKFVFRGFLSTLTFRRSVQPVQQVLVLPVGPSGPVCPLVPGCGTLLYPRMVLECLLACMFGRSTLSAVPLDLKNNPDNTRRNFHFNRQSHSWHWRPCKHGGKHLAVCCCREIINYRVVRWCWLTVHTEVDHFIADNKPSCV